MMVMKMKKGVCFWGRYCGVEWDMLLLGLELREKDIVPGSGGGEKRKKKAVMKLVVGIKDKLRTGQVNMCVETPVFSARK